MPGLQTTDGLAGASIADNLIKQGMPQHRTPSDICSDEARRNRKRRIIVATLAAVVLIGGFVISLPITDSHEGLFDRFRRGFDEHRRAFDQRRRAWEEQRRADEQAKRAAAIAASQEADQPGSAPQSANQ